MGDRSLKRALETNRWDTPDGGCVTTTSATVDDLQFVISSVTRMTATINILFEKPLYWNHMTQSFLSGKAVLGSFIYKGELVKLPLPRTVLVVLSERGEAVVSNHKLMGIKNLDVRYIERILDVYVDLDLSDPEALGSAIMSLKKDQDVWARLTLKNGALADLEGSDYVMDSY